MTRLELKTLAKAQINGSLVTLIFCSIIIAIINKVLISTTMIVGPIISMIIAPAFLLGMSNIYINLTNGIKPKIDDVFSGFKNFFKAWALSFLMGFFILLWTLLLIIPGIEKIFAYSMSFYILSENPDIPIKKALNESERLMEGHKIEFLILQLSFFWWIVLTLVTFGAMSIYVTPYIVATNTNFYKSLKADNISVEERNINEITYEEIKSTEGEA
ncbi:MAG: DUF975 family protein [Proteocatella sp.]